MFIREIIIKLNKDRSITFIISCHILGELSKIATSYGIIEKGELKRQILKIGMYSLKPIYTRAAVVGLIFLLAEIVLLCMVMRKKEIK